MKKIVYITLFLGVLTIAGCMHSKTNEKTDNSTGDQVNITGKNKSISISGKNIDNVDIGPATGNNRYTLNSSVSIDTGKLNEITIESTFPEEDQQKFREQLSNWQGKVDTETKAVNKARLHKNIGEVGKAINVYNKYLSFSGNKLSYPVTSNLGNLYADICNIDREINNKYCKRAMEYFRKMIKTYNELRYYEDIIRVLLDMGKKEKASQMYDTYLKKGGRKVGGFEKRFN